MRGKSYTFYIASSPGKLKKLIVPAYVLHGIAVLALTIPTSALIPCSPWRQKWP